MPQVTYRNLFLRSTANKVIGVTMNQTTGGTDHYASMQTTLNRRFPRGLTLGAQWTLGHSIGNSGGSNEANTATNPYNFRQDPGNNAFDVRQSANISALCELPFAKGQRYSSSMSRGAETLLRWVAS